MARTKTVLVTGGKGFIGSSVCRELRSLGYEPLVFDRHAVMAEEESVLGDIRDSTAVTESVSHVDGVIHLGGILGTQETVANPRPAVETNILGGINVLEACTQYNVPLVTISVGNWFENNPYSITKTTVERFTKMYVKYRGLSACTVRALNAFGPGQSVAEPYGSSKVRKVTPSFIMRALNEHPIEIYGDGNQIMDMVYVDDVAKTLVRSYEWLQAGNSWIDMDAFEAGTGRRTSVLEIAEVTIDEVQRQTGKLGYVTHLPMRKGETPGAVVLGNPDTLAPLNLDVADFVTLEEGTVRAVEYYKNLV